MSPKKARLVQHHDDPPCRERLTPDGACRRCGLHPDMQSTCLICHCPDCDTELRGMVCPTCNQAYIWPD